MAEAGITEIGIIVGDTRDEIMAAVGDGSDWGVKVTYIGQDAPLGLAHCVRIARDFLGDDDFVMYLGDNMLQQGLVEFIGRFEQDRRAGLEPTLDGEHHEPAAQILLCPVPDPQRFGVAEVDDAGHVVRLVEKPEHPPSNLALVGVYLFTSVIHEAVAAIEPSPRGSWRSPTPSSGSSTRATGCATRWWTAGGSTPARRIPCSSRNRRVLETIEPRIDGELDEDSSVDGRVVIEAGAQLINSTVRGPAIIGPGTRLVNSYIGPFTAVANDCEIVDSEVEHSVVLEHSRILGVPRLSDSLMGKYVEVRRSSDAAPRHPPHAGRPLQRRSRVAPSILSPHALAPVPSATPVRSVVGQKRQLGARLASPDHGHRHRIRRHRRRLHRRPHHPRRRAGLLRRDLPPRVVPPGPGDDPGQPGRPPGRRHRGAALPPAPGRLLVRALRHRPGRAARPAQGLAHRRRHPEPSTWAASPTAPTATGASSSRPGWPTASPPSPT